MASYHQYQDLNSSELSVQLNSPLQNSSPSRPEREIPIRVSSTHSQYPYFVQHRKWLSSTFDQRRSFDSIFTAEKHLPHRQWSPSYEGGYLKPYFKIHLICYNILAQKLLWENRRLYAQCFNQHLDWNRRRERLYKELLRQNADVRLPRDERIVFLQLSLSDHLLARGASWSLPVWFSTNHGVLRYEKGARLELSERLVSFRQGTSPSLRNGRVINATDVLYSTAWIDSNWWRVKRSPSIEKGFPFSTGRSVDAII